MDLVFTALTTKILRFQGIASRAEYWLFNLAMILGMLIIGGSFKLLENWIADGYLVIPFLILNVVFMIVFTVASISVSVRRLHDTGRGGEWFFITLIPIIGLLIFFYFMVLPSKRINNKFLRMVPGEPHQAELQGMPSGEGSASAVHDTVNTDEISVSARDAPVHKKPYSNPNIPSTQVSAERLVARKFGPILLMAIIVLLAFYRSDAYGTDILLTAGSHSAMAVGFGFALHGVFFPFFKKGKVKEYSVLPPLMLSTAFSFALSGIYYFSN